MKNRITSLLAAAVALALLVNQATAGTTWNGNNTTGNWGTASSWEGAVPTFAATTDLLFRNFSANNRTVGVLNSRNGPRNSDSELS